MNLGDIIGREPVASWRGGEKIPWNEPDFSARMLANHLDQNHDWASRRNPLISKHVEWLNRQIGASASILDLACGPGLYTQRLAALGHSCVGVDFSPAAIRYACEQAESAGLDCEYVLSDIRQYQPDRRFDCVMLIFGELNVFSRQDAETIMALCSRALKPGGLLLTEIHSFASVMEIGLTPPSWYSSHSGLFSTQPHLCLEERGWDASSAAAVTRYCIIDAATGSTYEYGSLMQAYRDDEIDSMLAQAGCTRPRVLARDEWESGDDFADKLVARVCYKQ
ncbi:MAG: class I SAM-dependent methyltransferase [Planctomycetes bacterium]|nr:class I SAM-dependent methyltransferase [Planctomycetota bacterium]